MRREEVIPYRANKRKLIQLMLAGLVAAISTVVISHLLGAFGSTSPDFTAMYGAILNDQHRPGSYSGTWWAGMVWHLANGAVIFPLLYDFLAARMVLPSQRYVKGVLFGGALWLFCILVIAPAAGDGIFFSNRSGSGSMMMVSLIAWLAYGLIFERMTKVRMVHHLGLVESEAA